MKGGEDPTFEGEFLKRGHLIKNWKQRRFKLYGNCTLKYYDNQDMLKGEGTYVFGSANIKEGGELPQFMSSVDRSHVLCFKLKRPTEDEFFLVTEENIDHQEQQLQRLKDALDMAAAKPAATLAKTFPFDGYTDEDKNILKLFMCEPQDQDKAILKTRNTNRARIQSENWPYYCRASGVDKSDFERMIPTDPSIPKDEVLLRSFLDYETNEFRANNVNFIIDCDRYLTSHHLSEKQIQFEHIFEKYIIGPDEINLGKGTEGLMNENSKYVFFNTYVRSLLAKDDREANEAKEAKRQKVAEQMRRVVALERSVLGKDGNGSLTFRIQAVEKKLLGADQSGALPARIVVLEKKLAAEKKLED